MDAHEGIFADYFMAVLTKFLSKFKAKKNSYRSQKGGLC